jgi:hypothetical protein
MLNLAFSSINRTSADSWEIDLENAVERGTDNYRAHYLVPMTALLNPERFRLVSLAAALEQDYPFVYSIELVSNYINWLTTTDTIEDFLIPYVPDSVVKAARAGRAVIMIFYGTEAQKLSFTNHPSGKALSVYDVVLDFVVRRRLPRKALWFFSGNLKGGEELSAWKAARLGSASATMPYEVRITELYLYMSQSMRRTVERGKQFSAQIRWSFGGTPGLHRSLFAFQPLNRPIESIYAGQASPAIADRKPTKLFHCMNRAVKAHRRLIVCHLQRLGLIERSLVSFNDPEPSSTVFEDASLQQAWETVQTKLPMTVDRDPTALWEDYYGNSIALSFTPEAWPYLETALSIVTESNYTSNSDVLVLSEKTWKVIASGHPFILVGEAGTLAEVRKFGFKTFSPFIDESYDTIPDKDDRMERIVASIRAVGALSSEELATLRRNLEPIVLHNLRHFPTVRSLIEQDFEDIEAQLNQGRAFSLSRFPLWSRLASMFTRSPSA